jgi:pilus assembly protein Flp/PilA
MMFQVLKYAGRIKTLKGQGGLTTVEYAVGGGILVAGIIAAFILLGGNVTAIINGIANDLPAP